MLHYQRINTRHSKYKWTELSYIPVVPRNTHVTMIITETIKHKGKSKMLKLNRSIYERICHKKSPSHFY